MLVVLIVLLEYKERGLVFGWPTTYNSLTCSKRISLSYAPIHFVLCYHGYAFAWAAVFTFWYHPMENTVGHVMGFIYTYIILLQGETSVYMCVWQFGMLCSVVLLFTNYNQF